MRSNPPLAYVAFSDSPTRFTPGRLRIRIPSKRKDEEFWRNILEEVTGIKGVLEVSLSKYTWSLLILHDRTEEEILTRLSSLQLFRMGSPGEGREEEKNYWTQLTQTDLKLLKAELFTVFGIIQLFNGRWLAPSSSLLNQAMKAWQQALEQTEAK